MTTWQQENKYDIAGKVVLFIISPFLSFVYSLRTMRTRSSYVAFFLFAVFFGMAFTVPSGKSETFKADGAYYRGWFDYDVNMPAAEFQTSLESYLKFDGRKIDFYFDTVSFVVSRFTDNYHYLFMVIAIVMAYFMLRSFQFLTAEPNLDFSIASFILAYLFIFKQIFVINGARFWTAAWVGVYVIFRIFQKDNKAYWLLAFLTPFFHGSFWIFVGVLILARFTKNFHKTWIVLFVLSFFLSYIAVDIIQLVYKYLPTNLMYMASKYINPEYIKLKNSVGPGYSWIPYTFNVIIRIYQILLIILFIINSKQIIENPKTKNLYLFLLVWLTIFNTFALIPSFGNRFIQMAWPVIAYIWLVHFKDKKYQYVLYAMPFVFLWDIFWMFYGRYTSVVSVDFFITNPISLIYRYLIVG